MQKSQLKIFYMTHTLDFEVSLCSCWLWPMVCPATRLALAGSSSLELQQFHEFSKGDDFHTQSLHLPNHYLRPKLLLATAASPGWHSIRTFMSEFFELQSCNNVSINLDANSWTHTQNNTAFLQIAQRLEQTSGHNECYSAPSPCLVPA